MTFDKWFIKMSKDEQAALCSYDVWCGAVKTAIELLIEEHEVLIRHKLFSNAYGVTVCIQHLKDMIEI